MKTVFLNVLRQLSERSHRRVGGLYEKSLSAQYSMMFFLCCASLTGCGLIKEKPPAQVDEMSVVGREIPPEQAEEILGEMGESFVYGPSLGETATNIGIAVAFPPYALYLIGNAILSVSGYQPVTVSFLLPEEEGQEWSDAVDTVMSGPGRVAAALAGKEARSREVTEEKMKQILERLPEQKSNDGGERAKAVDVSVDQRAARIQGTLTR